jgi:hypothetical protein
MACKHVDIMVVLSLYRLVEVEQLGLEKLILLLGFLHLLVDVANGLVESLLGSLVAGGYLGKQFEHIRLLDVSHIHISQ